jgi:hypothetical protein
VTERFGRIATVNLNGREFSSENFALSFALDFVTGSTPTKGQVELYNPADQTVKGVEKTGRDFPRCTITAGYESDSGIVFLGNIIKAQDSWTGPDRILKCDLMGAANLWLNARVSIAYSVPTPASTIISALLAKVGVTGAQIQPERDHVYPRYAVNTSFRQALIQLAKDTGSVFFERQGQIYFRAPTSRDQAPAIVLEPDAIIGLPQKTEKGWKFSTLFEYRMTSGVYVDSRSKRAPGTFRVLKGKHQFSTEGEASTEIEVEPA